MSSEHIYFHFKNEIYIQIKSELKKIMQAKAGQVGALVSWVEYVDLVGGEDSTMSCLLSMS